MSIAFVPLLAIKITFPLLNPTSSSLNSRAHVEIRYPAELCFLRSLVFEKALAGLAAQVVFRNQSPQVRARIETLPQLFLKRFHDLQLGIQSDEICQLERSHGKVVGKSNPLIDVFRRSDALFQAAQRFAHIG